MSDRPPLRSLLVANRGEIAVRIMRTCRTLGIETIAVYSDADRDALHVRLADRAVEIGPAAASSSYLSIDRVLDAARAADAEAIHPGYGFLAENAEFAAACEAAGRIFVGPRPESIRRMGDKSASREIAAAAGVPITPGIEDVLDATLAAAAAKIGYPLLLKPSAGGGGKGMRRVERAEDLAEAAAGARREAKASFGDDRLIVERYVDPARHIEVQVFADGEGDVIILGERECSLQRRHQKVIEEAPSPVVTDELRAHLAAASAALARAVRYRGAGTVEFLLAPDGAFYFLEMNTRLQVEHPVTEAVWGVDLVAAQIAVAAGLGLPDWLRNARPRGAAIEVRVYAEAPERGFLPTPGKVLRFLRPEGPGLRIDAAIDEEGVVSPHYDPMVAKIITWGCDRDEARRRMARAIADSALLGLENNLAFLGEMLRSDWFAAGDFHTRAIEQRIAAGSLLAEDGDAEIGAELLFACVSALTGAPRTTSVRSTAAALDDPFATLGSWRLGAAEARA